MKKISRRELLKLGASTTVGLGIGRFLTSCNDDHKSEKPHAIDSGLDDAGGRDAFTPSAKVAAIKGTDLQTMTRDALDALGGIGRIVKKGETVFIKPNMISLPYANAYDCFGTGDCTKPDIVIVVADECLKAGAKEVIIGDASHRKTFDWQYARTLDGSTNLVAEAKRLESKYSGKITLACLGEDSQTLIDIPSNTSLGTISIAALVANADRIISLPVMKTHSIAQLTLSLKNFIGVTALGKYAGSTPFSAPDGGELLMRLQGFDHTSPEGISAVFLDIVDALKPDLAIIDGSIGIEGNGPSVSLGGTTVNVKDRLGSWLVLASTDLVAADATAARVMSHDPAEVKQLVMASERGLGEINSDRIEIVGEKLDDMTMPWKKATLISLARFERNLSNSRCA
jgi:uncharacterized protein (DUF362 family)